MLITLPCCQCPHGLTLLVFEPADQLSQNLVMSFEAIKTPNYNFHSLSTFYFLHVECMSLHILKFMEVATYNRELSSGFDIYMAHGYQEVQIHVRVVTIDIEAFPPPWHQGSYPNIEEIKYDFNQHNYLLL
jgi:hypothetical protein